MVKKIIFALIIVFSISVNLFAETLAVTAPAGAVKKPAIPKEGLKLENAGKYLEARKIYQNYLKENALTKKSAQKLRERIEKLNIKILFSPTVTPDSVLHEVVEGDSLYKIAQKYHTTRALIKKSNHLQDDTIKIGTKLKVLNKPLFRISVDKTSNMLTLYLNDKPLKHYRVATGLEGGTPTGEFKIINKIENPTWYKTGAVVEAGDSKNELGTRWLGLDSPGYGIHGTTNPESIGTQSSSGCVRMLNREVEELFIIVPQGTVVKITE